jgi:lysozyme
MKLIVNVNKLNKRTSIPASLADKASIIGTVSKGFAFEGWEVKAPTNSSADKWYKDSDGYYYWGGGLVIKTEPPLENFPIHLPVNYKLGIDISHHNQNIDWNAIKNIGVTVVYIKITEGVGTPDAKAKENAEKAKAIGMQIGYYHFCRPDTRNGGTVESDASEEAKEVIKRFSVLPAYNMPLVLDLEDQQNWDTPLKPDDYLKWINTFIANIKANTGKDVAIYSRTEYLNRKLPKNHDLGKYKLWISYYPASPDCNKVVCPIGWNEWAMWQYTEHGIVGNTPKIDINIIKDNALA